MTSGFEAGPASWAMTGGAASANPRISARRRVIGGTGAGRRRRRPRASRRLPGSRRARPASAAAAARPRSRPGGAPGASRRRRPAGSAPSTTVTGAVTGQSRSARPFGSRRRVAHDAVEAAAAARRVQRITRRRGRREHRGVELDAPASLQAVGIHGHDQRVGRAGDEQAVGARSTARRRCRARTRAGGPSHPARCIRNRESTVATTIVPPLRRDGGHAGHAQPPMPAKLAALGIEADDVALLALRHEDAVHQGQRRTRPRRWSCARSLPGSAVQGVHFSFGPRARGEDGIAGHHDTAPDQPAQPRGPQWLARWRGPPRRPFDPRRRRRSSRRRPRLAGQPPARPWRSRPASGRPWTAPAGGEGRARGRRLRRPCAARVDAPQEQG